MPTLVQNQQSGPTVFSDPPNNIDITWEGKGHSTGMDVQQVPDTLVTENVKFLTAIRNGVFKVVEATDEVKERLAAQSQHFHQAKVQEEEAIREKLDKQEGPSTPTEMSVPRETDEMREGVPVEESIPIVMGPRERG